jgi:hypothetical protein
MKISIQKTGDDLGIIWWREVTPWGVTGGSQGAGRRGPTRRADESKGAPWGWLVWFDGLRVLGRRRDQT